MEEKKKKQSEISFRPGEIVWAKVKGYPWWPGIVIYFELWINLFKLDCFLQIIIIFKIFI